jgi:enoyl-CoA hydratase
MTDLAYIRVEWDGDLAVVIVDRQDKLNALNADVIAEIGEVFEGLRDDDNVRGVLLTGAGEKAFVAGADIGELAKMDAVSGVGVSRQGQQVFAAIERFPKPVLAAVGGYALGGGCELALACHLRIASERARFGLPEVGLGIIPGYGGTVRLSRLVGLGRAVQMTLTAVAVRMALESIYRAIDTATADALALESSLFGLLATTEDMKEGMSAFLEKREARFTGR